MLVLLPLVTCRKADRRLLLLQPLELCVEGFQGLRGRLGTAHPEHMSSGVTLQQEPAFLTS